MTFPDVFVTPFSCKAYEDGNLHKLADKGLCSCTLVVAVNRRNLDLFGAAVSLFYSFSLR